MDVAVRDCEHLSLLKSTDRDYRAANAWSWEARDEVKV